MTDEQFKELIDVLRGSTWTNLWPILLTFLLGLCASGITNFITNRKIKVENKNENVKLLGIRLNDLFNDLSSIGKSLPISTSILEYQMLNSLKEIDYLTNLYYEITPAKSLEDDLIKVKSEIKSILYSIDTISDSEIKLKIDEANAKLYSQMEKHYFKYEDVFQSEEEA